MESHKIHVPNHQPDNHILESQKHFSHRDDALSFVLGLAALHMIEHITNSLVNRLIIMIPTVKAIY